MSRFLRATSAFVAGIVFTVILASGDQAPAAVLDAKSMALAAAAPTTLSQAIISTGRASKGQVYAGRAISKDSGLAYEVRLLSAGKYYAYDVNPKTGKVTISIELKDPDLGTMKGLASVRVSIDVAVKTAEKTGKGRAIAATYSDFGKGGAYIIEIIGKKELLKTITIDAATGNVLKSS